MTHKHIKRLITGFRSTTMFSKSILLISQNDVKVRSLLRRLGLAENERFKYVIYRRTLPDLKSDQTTSVLSDLFLKSLPNWGKLFKCLFLNKEPDEDWMTYALVHQYSF